MTLNMAKQAHRLREGDHSPEVASRGQVDRLSSGAARGDCEAFVPFKNVWTLLVAAWKSTSLLPTMTFRSMATYRIRSLKTPSKG